MKTLALVIVTILSTFNQSERITIKQTTKKIICIFCEQSITYSYNHYDSDYDIFGHSVKCKTDWDYGPMVGEILLKDDPLFLGFDNKAKIIRKKNFFSEDYCPHNDNKKDVHYTKTIVIDYKEKTYYFTREEIQKAIDKQWTDCGEEPRPPIINK